MEVTDDKSNSSSVSCRSLMEELQDKEGNEKLKIVIIDKSVMFYYKGKEKNETKTEDVRSGEVFVWFGF